MDFMVKPLENYPPQIGHLLFMMNYARYTTLKAVEGLTIEQLLFI